ncbi:kinase-like domain-containing protein [Mycena galericulata]|nr:kinase-like domain-containing protein [Mycena galericulata]KAJ7472425.1 kinase-like domain-containing protein [Mycena galericulata]KAJ7503407.1 kinase-like domain-containing protein [Mycena galericulata]
MTADSPNTSCSGGEDACLQHFEYKTSAGRCHKCCLLANVSAEEHARIMELPQCRGCGNTSTRLTTDYCGACERKNAKQPAPAAAIPAIPALSQIRNLGQFHRSNWKDAANINNSSIRAQQSTVAITGSNMAALRNNNLATTECYAFILEPFVNLKPCDYLPTFDVTREGSVKFSELLEIAIACFNSSWEGGSEAGLDCRDIRFSMQAVQPAGISEEAPFGPAGVDPASMGPAMVEILNKHERSGESISYSSEQDIMRLTQINVGVLALLSQFGAVLRDCCQNLEKTVPPKFRNRKFAAVYLEAHIDLDKFHARTGALPPQNVISKSKKRTWSANTSISGASILKRTRLGSGGSHTLKSAFVLMAPALPLDPTPVADTTSVTLFFAKQTSDPVKGLQNFAWTTENPISNSVMLENGPINKGRSKLVFKLTIDGVAYVAKRCYSIGNGSPVSIVDNRDQLIKEGTTLGRTKFFLNSFKKECGTEEIEISEFEVTDFIIAREGVDGLTDSFTPSPASGIRQSDYTSLPDTEKDELRTNTALISSVTWLLEPERGNVQLRKYSGTLDHPRYSDKQGATINAFQHFSYLYSNNTLVLADIQASESHNPLSKASILFDIMSHTLDGTSGAGDHGKDGIKSFVEQHECVQKCTLMGMKALKESEGEDEDVSSNRDNRSD